MSSERLRQREAHKYYQSWLESSVGFQQEPTTKDTRFHADGTKLDISKDIALIAFAQLGCLKLNIKRGIVTLISTSRQYILAEATQTTSLLSKHSSQDTDDIWFGNASIPRSQGVSGTALAPPEYTAVSPNGDSFTAPALVINNLADHPDFSSRAYAGNGVCFYAGIPIVTKGGDPIGVYSLSDDKPRDGLHADEMRYLCDLAVVMMRHFETVKNEAARFRGELMVAGLGQFVQGASSINTSGSHRPHVPMLQSRVELDRPLESREFKGMTVTAADPTALRTVSVSEQPESYTTVTKDNNTVEFDSASETIEFNTDGPHSDSDRAPRPGSDANKSRSGHHTAQNTFSRAANILRECCGADGVLFFDAVSTNLAKRSSTTGFRSANRILKSKVVTHEDASQQRESHASDSHASAATESEGAESSDESVKACKLLGFAVDVTDQTVESSQALKRMAMTERILRRLIRKYPQGKAFYFSPDGSMSSSENDLTTESVTSKASSVILQEEQDSGAPNKNFKHKFADELKRLVPQAQSVIWLPMWDFFKQRWSAGAFLWTKMAERLIVAQEDLIYLKTFANSIMMEVARQDAAFADDTKTTFIANISHELRSPLHGVIGSCELLKDTHLDEQQAPLVRAIELCGKTLNDTVDHVLDYTKISQYMKRGGQPLKPGGPKSKRQDIPAIDRSMLDDDFDLALLVQDVVETACASQPSHHQRVRRQSVSNLRDVVGPAQTTDQKIVPVIFKLMHQDNWWVQSQPGAIRRILSNLVQNAIKYTDSGTVTIELSSRSASPRRTLDEVVPENQQDVTLIVRDTGKGMSNEFVRDHAFTPFSQESSFSDGAGLGLSIVQLVVDSLGGNIELKSNPGVGTEIKVHLTLSRSEPIEASSDDDSRTSTARMKGKKICMIHEVAESRMRSRRSLEKALSSTASTWFGMDIVRSTSLTDVQADFYLYSPIPKADDIVHLVGRGSLPSNTAMILLVSSAAEKLHLKKDLEFLEDRGLILEIILHPVGPRKLGEALKKCLSQKEKVPKSLSAVPVGLRRSSAHMMGTPTEQDEVGIQKQRVEDGEIALNHGRHTLTLRPRTPKILQGSLQMTSTPGPSDSASQTVTPTRESMVLATAEPLHKRVLLVDDNAINLNILKTAMKKGNFPFHTANDGLEALEAFKQAACADPKIERPFTHVLMDISMPVMDGIESTRLIRNFERTHRNRRPIKRLRQQSARSEPGKSNIEYPRSSSPAPSDDDYTSDSAESLPMSPEIPTEVASSGSRSQRVRPLLSHNPRAGGPMRATTDTWDRDRSRSPPPGLSEEGQPQRATIIALSGVAFEQTQNDMFVAGADMFFAKPIKLKELLKILNDTPSTQV